MSPDGYLCHSTAMNPVFRDRLRIFKHLNYRRLFNILKIHFSYHLSRITGKNLHVGLPFSVSIEPTTSCNLRCPECPSGLRSFTRPTGMLDVQLFEKAIDELSDHLVYLILYFQGEPYLHPGFHQLVQYAKQKKIYVATSTNAHYLDEENARKTVLSGLDRLIISLDGADQETYESYRVGGRMDRVLEGTKNIIKWRNELKSPTPLVVFQFLVTGQNEHQIPEIKRLAEAYQVDDVWLKTAQIYDFENGSELIPTQNRYSRYRKKPDGKWELKNQMANECWRLWHSSVITWDGKVIPCCFDKDAAHQMGKIGERPFQEIWRSAEYEAFRTKLLNNRSAIEMCKNCTEGTEVWV